MGEGPRVAARVGWFVRLGGGKGPMACGAFFWRSRPLAEGGRGFQNYAFMGPVFRGQDVENTGQKSQFLGRESEMKDRKLAVGDGSVGPWAVCAFMATGRPGGGGKVRLARRTMARGPKILLVGTGKAPKPALGDFQGDADGNLVGYWTSTWAISLAKAIFDDPTKVDLRRPVSDFRAPSRNVAHPDKGRQSTLPGFIGRLDGGDGRSNSPFTIPYYFALLIGRASGLPS